MSPPKTPADPHLDRKTVQIRTEHGRAEERRRILADIMRALTSTLDLPTVLHLFLDRIAPLLTYPGATAIGLLGPGTGKRLHLAAFRNLDREKWKAEDWSEAHGVLDQPFEAKVSLVIDNFRTDSRVKDPAFFLNQGLISYLGIPLVAQEVNVGVLSIYAREEHHFTDEEVELLSAIASEAAMAVRNALLHEEARRRAAELERSNKAKSEFLSVMSHELTTPLTAIMGYTEMIENGTYGGINEDQRGALQRITKHSTDLLDTFNAILGATKIESNSLEPEVSEVNLKNLLDELKSTYDARLNTDVALIWDYPAEFPSVKTDSDKLTHILQNLINNAIKFTDRGKVTVSTRLPSGSRTVEFTVADTGIGIPSEEIPNIFDMFRQVDRADGRDYAGVGMGLYIVRRFTEVLGGRVDVKSVMGEGSTFTITIPCGS